MFRPLLAQCSGDDMKRRDIIGWWNRRGTVRDGEGELGVNIKG